MDEAADAGHLILVAGLVPIGHGLGNTPELIKRIGGVIVGFGIGVLR